MSHCKHLYHVIFVTVRNNVLSVAVEMNLWADNKLDVYRVCKARLQDDPRGLILFDARYIK